MNSQPLPFDPIEEARRHWLARWGENAATPMAAITSIMRVQQILMARLNELLAPLGLTFPRYEALMLLHFSSRGSLPLGKIGERLQVHRTSVTNTIDGLERAGLVRRVPHESDRRAVLAEILPQGRETAEAATALLNAAEFGTEPLGDEDLTELFAILRKLRDGAGDFGP
ncbi:MAG TPA: MarR family transcriptional regulator [Solirubrobacterales bacterium]|nr:MarR family transcriptional regulator [Solirubrobacterales bacterium]